MKFHLLSLLGLSLLTACGPLLHREPVAVREISGVLTVDTRLEGEVLLVDDLLVPVGRTLTIAAGTTLRIRKSESTKIDPEYLSPATELLVRGTLQALGSAEAPVRILPEVATPPDGEFAWAGILFDGGAGTIAWTEIEGAESGILCLGAAPLLEHNTLRLCRYGIIAQHGSAPRILNNALLDGEGGLFCWSGSNPTVRDNRIAGNAEEGLVVDRSSRPLLAGNQITGNDLGLVLGRRDLSLATNVVSGNREDLRYLDGGAP